VQATQLQHPGLGRAVDLVWDASWPMGAVRERLDTACLVTAQPGVQALACHPELLGDLGHCEAVFDDAHDGVVTLLHLALLPEHLAAPLLEKARRPGRGRGVKHQPNARQASGEVV